MHDLLEPCISNGCLHQQNCCSNSSRLILRNAFSQEQALLAFATYLPKRRVHKHLARPWLPETILTLSKDTPGSYALLSKHIAAGVQIYDSSLEHLTYQGQDARWRIPLRSQTLKLYWPTYAYTRSCIARLEASVCRRYDAAADRTGTAFCSSHSIIPYEDSLCG